MFKLKPFIIALALSSLTTSALAANTETNRNKLPEIGSAGVSVLSIEKERQIGGEMMRQIRASQPILNDPVLTEYINDLGNRMVRNAKDVNYSFEFFVIRNQELNAFAFFGGHIAIHCFGCRARNITCYSTPLSQKIRVSKQKSIAYHGRYGF